MGRLGTERRGQVVSRLVEGMSIRATHRVTGVAEHTVVELLVDLVRACSEHPDRTLRSLSCTVVECDVRRLGIGDGSTIHSSRSRGAVPEGEYPARSSERSEHRA